MNYCHSHNSNSENTSKKNKKYGIKITLPKGDSLRKILGENWSKKEWFETKTKRDNTYKEMKKRHGYYRKTDTPTQIIEKISK
ncbi:MAG: hypothetical protein VX469_06215 [Pseudomonadota bacterium]|nr:hypothetical protein [Pseudomonadota bacterium]